MTLPRRYVSTKICSSSSRAPAKKRPQASFWGASCSIAEKIQPGRLTTSPATWKRVLMVRWPRKLDWEGPSR